MGGSVNFSRFAVVVVSSFVLLSLTDPEHLPHRLRSSHGPQFSAEAAGQSSIHTLRQLPPFPSGLPSDLQLRTRLFTCPSCCLQRQVLAPVAGYPHPVL
jgi:hypothetical protein